MSSKDDILVKVEGLGKKFCKDFSRSLRYGLKDVVRSTFGFKGEEQLRKDEFWALNGIDFQLKRGECIGLIGHNGAGKSTLLKILNGIIKPDKGRVTMNGRVGALIELGAGFNPILTGRENIYNNGAVLGFTKEQMDQKLEEIIEFSELGDFIDSPVRNYSSGMKVRLGFAVASNLEPDILIIDEVLAVGDTGFKLKCFNKLDELLQSASVIFVSHNMPQILRMSSQVILLDKGTKKFHGTDIGQGIEMYYGRFNFSESVQVFSSGEVDLHRFELKNDDGEVIESIEHLDDLHIEMELSIDQKYPEPVIGLVFFDKELKPAATVFHHMKNRPGPIKFRMTIPRVNLTMGSYSLTLNIKGRKDQSAILREEGLASLSVRGDEMGWSPVMFDSILTELPDNV